MYWPLHDLKGDPEARWAQTDRVFFGFGACHILAGVFLDTPPFHGFYGEWIVPDRGFRGTHFYVTNGHISFDYHGFCYLKICLHTLKAGIAQSMRVGQARLRK